MPESTVLDEIGGAARNFVLREIGDGPRLGLDDPTGGVRSDFCRVVAAQGWYAMALPLDSGGLGLGRSSLGVVASMVGEFLLPGPMLECMLVPSLLAGLADGDAAERLRRTAEAGVPVAVVDGCGSALWADRIGRLRLGGGHLNGQVELVRGAEHAGSLVVIAERGGSSVLSMVDVDQPGVTVQRLNSYDPVCPTSRVRFQDAVPLDGLAASEPAHLSAIRYLRACMRLLIACELAGIGQRLLAATATHIQTRHQFGRAIGAFQAVQHIAANMYASNEALGSMALVSVREADSADLDGLELTAMCTKAWAAETAREICEAALQLHGGIGFTYEHELHWYYKHALSLRGWMGDERELEIEIGRKLLARAGRGALDGGLDAGGRPA